MRSRSITGFSMACAACTASAALLTSSAQGAVISLWDFRGVAAGTNNITGVTSSGSSSITLAGSGNTAPSGVTTTIGGVARSAAQFTAAATPDYLVASSVASGLNFTSTSSFTVEGLVNLASFAGSGSSRTIFSTRGSSSVSNAGFTLSVAPDGKASFFVDGGSFQNTVSSSAILNLGEWVSIAGTYTGSDRTIRVYINGVQSGSNPAVPAGTWTTTDKPPAISWAQNGTVASTSWDGMIAAVRVSDAALSLQSDFLAVPEPAGMMMTCVFGGAAMLRRRSRR